MLTERGNPHGRNRGAEREKSGGKEPLTKSTGFDAQDPIPLPLCPDSLDGQRQPTPPDRQGRALCSRLLSNLPPHQELPDAMRQSLRHPSARAVPVPKAVEPLSLLRSGGSTCSSPFPPLPTTRESPPPLPSLLSPTTRESPPPSTGGGSS